ncbi:ubiquinol-cytochrome c reductase iron-sulfur subunit [Bacteroidota bacterium]
MQHINRRGFLRRASLLLASIAGVFASVSILKQLSQKGIRRNRLVNLGKLTDFPVDTYTLLHDQKLFIYRDHESIKAISAVCTHLGCTIQHTSAGFECPCHGSCYSNDGEVLSGPAPRALPGYKVQKAPDGSIVVDLDEVGNAATKYTIS